MIGIERITFSTSKYFIDMGDLAEARGQAKEKYYLGIMQNKMAAIPPCEDIVTLGYDAAYRLLGDVDISKIELLIFATESGIDESKSAAIYIHKFLGLSNNCRVFEIKQACYGGTAALFTAYDFVKSNSGKKALIVMADVTRYGLNTVGEPTQGGGAVALIVSDKPDIAIINCNSGKFACETMDFWRPIGRDNALVNGTLSSKRYLLSLKSSYSSFMKKNNLELDYFCYHTPFCKMALKGHNLIRPGEDFNYNSIIYNREVGNCYTASLYLSFISILDFEENLSEKDVGMFSYGAGSMAEYFSLKVQKDYKNFTFKSLHGKNISDRLKISIAEYERMYTSYHVEEVDFSGKFLNTGHLSFNGTHGNIRIYSKLD